MLKEGNLLSEIRHSLTHKHMVADAVVSRARDLILMDLRTSYWQKIYSQMVEEGLFSKMELENEHLRIFKTAIDLPRGMEDPVASTE